MFDLEKTIAEWRQQMLAAGIKTPVPLEELEIHLREETERQIQSGLSAQQAFKTGILKIGQSRELKREFAKVGGTRESRLRKLVVVVATANIMFGALWILAGLHSIHQIWHFTRLRVVWTEDTSYWCFAWGISFYGAVCGFLVIRAAIQLFRRRTAGLNQTAAYAVLTILGILADVAWRIPQFAQYGVVEKPIIGGIVFLLYPIFLLALCKSPRIKEQYV